MAPTCSFPGDEQTRARFRNNFGTVVALPAWRTSEYRVNKPTWRKMLRENPMRAPYHEAARLQHFQRYFTNANGYTRPQVLNAVLDYGTEQMECVVCGRNPEGPICGQACLNRWYEADGAMGRLQNLCEVRTMPPESRIPGQGLFLREHLPEGLSAGQHVGEYVGELVPLEGPDDALNDAADSNYVYNCNDHFNIDAEKWGNETRFINHHCRANLVAESIVVGGRRIVAFRALRDIAAGEELTVDYGQDFFQKTGELCFCNVSPVPHVPTPPAGTPTPDPSEGDDGDDEADGSDGSYSSWTDQGFSGDEAGQS
ncbi:hypothetical protein PG999_014193 [Apiospora kogelbergensis]|uniref:SET domain-containing protein n=1 Tax=Apiospora kogelbergensis TaxID=1337665 RepID=A0AAW0Q6I5_9PEZI